MWHPEISGAEKGAELYFKELTTVDFDAVVRDGALRTDVIRAKISFRRP